ncbi:MAG: hypothetical protein ACRC2M_15295 [Planktothrix sp.]
MPVNFELRQGAGCAFRGFAAMVFFDESQVDIGDGAIKFADVDAEELGEVNTWGVAMA